VEEFVYRTQVQLSRDFWFGPFSNEWGAFQDAIMRDDP